MTVINNKSFTTINDADFDQRGSSVLEVLLAVAIVALLAPFMYNMISESAKDIQDINTARGIIGLRDEALNFVRLNQYKWPDVAQIQLDPEELATITEFANSGFIDKYYVRGAVITDIYLAFDLGNKALSATKIAKHIGTDAATVMDDGIAYGSSWAMAAPELKPGQLVYRINYDFNGDDNSKYLHRGTSGEDDFTTMFRTLNMGKFDIHSIGTVASESAKIDEAVTAFAEAANTIAETIYFTNGAIMDGNQVKIGTLRVNGDITGFRTISAAKLNGNGFSTSGTIVADRASIKNSIYVGKDMTLKSDSYRTVSGFSGMIAHSLETPYVYTDEMVFYNNFGLTVSGELLMSTTTPVRIGNWYFPSTTPPRFVSFELSRASIPEKVIPAEFDKLIKSGWKDIQAATPEQP